MDEIIKHQRLISWGTPLIVLALLIFSFGFMIPQLGYGFDEWHFIYYSTRGTEGLFELFHYDGHPQATWAFIQSFNFLGYNPLYWHSYSLFWRFFAVFSFWLCLRGVWKEHHRQNFLVAALFSVYPIFTLQIFPISFFEIWINYTFLFLSFYFTIQAIQHHEKFSFFIFVAIALSIGHVFTREYAWFVELMRPVFIWLVIAQKEDFKKRVFQTAKIWFPFFIIFFSALIWRGFFYTPLRKFFQVQDSLFENPIATVAGWVTNFIPDLLIVLITSWYETLLPSYLYFVRPFNVALFVLIVLVAILVFLYAKKIDLISLQEGWSTQAIILGLPSLLFGILPFYIASYSLHLTDPPHNSRLVIGMLPGAALISIALIEKVISKTNPKIIIHAILLSLAVSWHVRYTNDFRKVWEYQSNFLQQLTWRVPGIEKNTALFVYQPNLPEIDNSNADIVRLGDFALSMAINSLYQVTPEPTESKLSYWYYYVGDSFMDLSQETAIYSEHATTYFEGNSIDSLLFYYDPQNDRCLHLLTTQDQFYKQYPEAVHESALYANVSRVINSVVQDVELKNQILGENNQGWCFFYQKAELAKQYQQWEQIPLLWEQVEINKLRTEFGTEYIPFVEGFAYVGEWEKAEELTKTANRISKAMDSILCPIWAEIDAQTPDSREKNEAIQNVKDILGCINP